VENRRIFHQKWRRGGLRKGKVVQSFSYDPEFPRLVNSQMRVQRP